MEKVGLIDDEKEDSVSYHFKSTYYYNEQRSGGLTGNEEIFMPHFVLLVSPQSLVTYSLRGEPLGNYLFTLGEHEALMNTRSIVH